MPELDRHHVVGVSLARLGAHVASARRVLEPRRELVDDRGQAPRRAERLESGLEVTLLLGGRRPRLPRLALVPGEAAIRLDVEAEALRGAFHPAVDDLGLGDAVEGGVDLDEGEEARVVAELLALAPSLLQLRRIEVLVVDPVGGAHENRCRH